MIAVLKKYSDVKIVRYGFVGAISTMIHIASAFLYLYLINDSIYMSNIIGFLAAFGFSYIVQSKLVFRHAVSYTKAMKYFIVQFISLLIAIAMSNYVPLSDTYLKVLLVIIILPLVTYTIHKMWTFGGSYD